MYQVVPSRINFVITTKATYIQIYSTTKFDVPLLLFCDQLSPPAPQSTGRSGNVWISPKGSMMFSMAVQFLPTTKLAQRMPLLQHLVAMAVVHGIKTIPGYEVCDVIHNSCQTSKTLVPC